MKSSPSDAGRPKQPPESTPHDSPAGISRRAFGKATALTLAGGVLAGRDLSFAHAAQDKNASSGAQAEVERKLQNVIAKWGDRLSEEQRRRVRRVLQSHVRMLESVRAFPVANGDSPASVLKLIAGDSAKPRSKPSNGGARRGQ